MSDPLSILKQYWGYDNFRGIQESVITSICEGRDTLCLMPTGGGKSICFQVPALAMEGLCIVVSPLIALMKDQVQQLRRRGIKAVAIYSGMSHDSILEALDNCILGDYKLLYVSPERLITDIFRAKMQRVPKVSMITVDEAHCVSQWGYDFRPPYLRISELRQLLGTDIPILALTATATPEIVDDIQNKLHFREKNVLSMSFERKNLIYVVRKSDNKAEDLLNILAKVPQGSSIVYVRNRKDTQIVSKYLTENGISAHAYNAGLSASDRNKRQDDWIAGKVRVMVATNAFGMGIDKPDVRVVVHIAPPSSLEAYFQEAGRAGRDGLTSYAVMLYYGKDIQMLRHEVPSTYPEPEYISRVYEDLCYFLQVGIGESLDRTYLFDIGEFCRTFHHFSLTADSALKILSYAGYIEYHEMDDIKSRAMFILEKADLYRLQTNDSVTDLLISTLLRNYPGIFAEFKYLDERDIAQKVGITPEQVYFAMKELAQRRIINYVPHRSVPTVTFTRARVDTESIYLSADVYKDRKVQFARRIESMIEFLTDETESKSTLLLRYFGEEKES